MKKDFWQSIQVIADNQRKQPNILRRMSCVSNNKNIVDPHMEFKPGKLYYLNSFFDEQASEVGQYNFTGIFLRFSGVYEASFLVGKDIVPIDINLFEFKEL